MKGAMFLHFPYKYISNVLSFCSYLKLEPIESDPRIVIRRHTGIKIQSPLAMIIYMYSIPVRFLLMDMAVFFLIDELLYDNRCHWEVAVTFYITWLLYFRGINIGLGKEHSYVTAHENQMSPTTKQEIKT